VRFGNGSVENGHFQPFREPGRQLRWGRAVQQRQQAVRGRQGHQHHHRHRVHHDDQLNSRLGGQQVRGCQLFADVHLRPEVPRLQIRQHDQAVSKCFLGLVHSCRRYIYFNQKL